MVSDNSRTVDVSCFLDQDAAVDVFLTQKWCSLNLGTSVEKLQEICAMSGVFCSSPSAWMRWFVWRTIGRSPVICFRCARQRGAGFCIWLCPSATSSADSPRGSRVRSATKTSSVGTALDGSSCPSRNAKCHDLWPANRKKLPSIPIQEILFHLDPDVWCMLRKMRGSDRGTRRQSPAFSLCEGGSVFVGV